MFLIEIIRSCIDFFFHSNKTLFLIFHFSYLNSQNKKKNQYPGLLIRLISLHINSQMFKNINVYIFGEYPNEFFINKIISMDSIFYIHLLPIYFISSFMRARTSQYTRLYDRNQIYFFFDLTQRRKKIENGHYHRQCSLKSFFSHLAIYIGREMSSE